jgi:methionyl-tRNA synthetase
MTQRYYLTTAISYPNGRPHIGHAYEAIAADVVARFKRQRGFDVRLVTGTDEHGLKMAQTARGAGRDTLEFADEMSSYFRVMCERLNISFTHFMRTTDPRHHLASVALWERMAANDDLYLDRYEGWYSVRDEAFYEESELSKGAGGEWRSPQDTPVEWTVEESWFFRLSRYQQPLLDLYRDQPDFIQPTSRRNEVMRFVEGGLRDLSVSRTSFDWGVPVPGSPGHVMYVWVDALATYLSGLGFPDEGSDFADFWPANLHLIGKDIVRFHAVYWPAFLMSAGLPLPKAVFGHGFLLSKGEKMSKSLGNVVDPIDLVDYFGVDTLRYYLLREVSFGQDGSYSAEAIVRTCNADLANSFGNLAQRALSMIFKNLDGAVPVAGDHADDQALLETVRVALMDEMAPAFDQLNFSGGIEAWLRAVFACNQFVDSQAPWALRKSDPERMTAVLGTLFQAVRDLTIAIAPVIPDAAGRLLKAMKIDEYHQDIAHIGQKILPHNLVIDAPQPLFPRLDLPEGEG